MTGTRPSQWIGDAAGTLTMIWERFFGDVADVPVVSPTSQLRLEKFNSVQLLIMSPMHRRHVPVDAGASPSLMTIWKPGFTVEFSIHHQINKIAGYHKRDLLLSFYLNFPENNEVIIFPPSKSMRCTMQRKLVLINLQYNSK